MKVDAERRRKDHNLRVEQRKQMAQILTEAEYEMNDKNRAKAADQMEWLHFETRMRNMVRKVLEPVISMTTEDREDMMNIDERNID